MRERREKEIFDIWTDRKFGKFRHNYPGKEYLGRWDGIIIRVNPLGLFSGNYQTYKQFCTYRCEMRVTCTNSVIHFSHCAVHSFHLPVKMQRFIVIPLSCRSVNIPFHHHFQLVSITCCKRCELFAIVTFCGKV